MSKIKLERKLKLYIPGLEHVENVIETAALGWQASVSIHCDNRIVTFNRNRFKVLLEMLKIENIDCFCCSADMMYRETLMEDEVYVTIKKMHLNKEIFLQYYFTINKSVYRLKAIRSSFKEKHFTVNEIKNHVKCLKEWFEKDSLYRLSLLFDTHVLKIAPFLLDLIEEKGWNQ